MDLANPSDHDLVVAALQHLVDDAVERRDRPLQPRQPGLERPMLDLVPARVRTRTREVARQQILAVGQHVDGELAVGANRVERLANRARHTSSSAGSADSEQTALTVVPIGPPPACSDVTTVDSGRQMAERVAQLRCRQVDGGSAGATPTGGAR